MSATPNITLRSLGLIGLLGGVGGAINAWLDAETLLLGETPGELLADVPSFFFFGVLPRAGGGGLLALVSVSMAVWLFKRH